MLTIQKSDDIEAVFNQLRHELYRAMEKHAPMHSAHEGYSVIHEELDELWEHVKKDTGHTADARKEALQVAAMGIRYALDISPVQDQTAIARADQRPAPVRIRDDDHYSHDTPDTADSHWSK